MDETQGSVLTSPLRNDWRLDITIAGGLETCAREGLVREDVCEDSQLPEALQGLGKTSCKTLSPSSSCPNSQSQLAQVHLPTDLTGDLLLCSIFRE